MKRIQYKIAVLVVFISTSLIAQKQNHRRTYNEEFSTNKDVVIDVNTRNTDVIIETWNKNKVSIEAIIEVEGAEDERAERTLDNWKFNAVGNKSEVEISSRSSGVSNHVFSNDDLSQESKHHENHTIYLYVELKQLIVFHYSRYKIVPTLFLLEQLMKNNQYSVSTKPSPLS